MVKVSVVIPVYRVEPFIVRCAESLMRQTLQDVEYIFVDDASPDKSMDVLGEVLRKYPERTGQVRIIHHKENKGLPAARNTGLSIAAGEYIFHCDSDDWMEPDMLEELYTVAKKNVADIVWCDWFLTFADNQRYMRQPRCSSPVEAMRSMLSGAMKFNVWNKLVRRQLYSEHHIQFPVGYSIGEDMTMIMLFVHAERVAYIPCAYYHYVKTNTLSFTQRFNEHMLDELRYNVERVTAYVSLNTGLLFTEELEFFKLDAKFPLLITFDQRMYHLWGIVFPEANAYIWQNKLVPLRSRCLQWLAKKRMFTIIWLYNKVFIQFVYGILYR